VRPGRDDWPDRTLGIAVADWILDNCAVPDGDLAGEPFRLSDDQLHFVAWFYAVDEVGKFLFRRALLVRPQKFGKGPLSSAIICAEAAGPARFSHFDEGGNPVGKPWPTPWIQVVAASEDQTDNVWTSLVPMIELGNLSADVPDTGKTRINVRGENGSSGVIEPVTSAAISRLGQRLTFANHDETGYWTEHNGGIKLADTQRRNLAGMGGRSLETTNAWDPAESSVAQRTFEANLDDVLIDYPEPPEGSVKNKRERRKVLNFVYAGAPWVDKDRIEAEIDELLPTDPNQAERFFLNRIVAGADSAFDAEAYRALAKPGVDIPKGALVALGFDGSLYNDATGLIATDIETGHQIVVGAWQKPEWEDDEWMVPVDDVNDSVAFAFDQWKIWSMYADPPYWQDSVDRWAGQYGNDKVKPFWTNQRKKTAFAVREFKNDMRPEVMSHTGDERLVSHVEHSVRRDTNMRDEDGHFLWLIGKEGAKSAKKIDLAMAAILSWKARGDAINDGALKKRKGRLITF
jgi:hypothetical protein